MEIASFLWSGCFLGENSQTKEAVVRSSTSFPVNFAIHFGISFS